MDEESKPAVTLLMTELPTERLNKCPSCSSVAIRELPAYAHAFLARCAACGFVFCDRKVSRQELMEHYNKYPRSTSISPITVKRYRELLDELEVFRGGSRILDVGCGDGHFLVVARERGWEVYGTEYTPAAVAVCEEKGIRMGSGTLDDAGFSPASFDVITSFEVIEHLPHPGEEALRLFRLLRNGGCCYVTTPNFNSVSRRLLGSRWNVIEYPEHLGYFTRSSLKNLFARAGFRHQRSATTGISLDRVRVGLGGTRKAQGMDEAIRQHVEESRLVSWMKRIANFLLNATSTGDSLKAFFIKP